MKFLPTWLGVMALILVGGGFALLLMWLVSIVPPIVVSWIVKIIVFLLITAWLAGLYMMRST